MRNNRICYRRLFQKLWHHFEVTQRQRQRIKSGREGGGRGGARRSKSGELNLASGASFPSDVNGRLPLYVTRTAHTVYTYVLLILRAHSRSPTILLVYQLTF